MKIRFTMSMALAVLCFNLFGQVKPILENQTGISARLQLEINNTKDPALGFVPKDRLQRAYEVRNELVEKHRMYKAASLTWTERGPYSDAVGGSNGNTRPGNGKTSGRIRAMWEDLGDSSGKTVWVGGVDGGLWKTNDITANPANWVSINDFFGNLSIGSICQDPTNPDIMYFGTGEKAINADAVRGAGIWKSTDHGENWTVMSGTSSFYNVSKMVCDASGNLYVGCIALTSNIGLKRFNKSTSTWTTITPSGLIGRITDIEISSTGRMHITCGYYNSTTSNSGYRYTDYPSTVTTTTWSSPSTTFSAQYNVDLATKGDTLYATPSNSSWEVPTIYKSTNGGVNWSAVASTPTFTSGQSWYCMAVAVDPNNANNVIVGSLDCYRSTNGGSSWTKISNWVGTTGQYVHADQQAMIWRNNNRLLVASDGGIHFSANGGTTFTDRNVGLRIKQFYSVAISPTSTNYFLGGTQDNGTHQLNGAGLTTSIEVTGGDGGFVHIDQNQDQYQFASYVYGQYRRSTNGGSTWTNVNYSAGSGRFINPTDYDDVNNIMYCGGNSNQYILWSNPQTGSSFSPITMSGLNSGTVSAIKVSPYTNHTVYFAGGGSGVAPSLIKVTNANSSPTFTSIIGSGMTTSSANISCVELGADESNILVVYSNYGINNVWITSNGGSSWTAIDGNLPDMPVRWAMYHPGDNSKIILATETGIWQTDSINGSSTVWSPETSFPNVRTDMFQYRSSDGIVAAATHGRGIFTGYLTPPASCGDVIGLTSNSVTDSSATINWTALSGAISYDVDYKLNSISTWTNRASGYVGTSIALSGLTNGSLYDYRIRANCSSAVGSFSQQQFTTSSPVICNTPTGLIASSIANTTVTISWSAANGAVNYSLDYKLSSSSTWDNILSGTTSRSLNLSGLTAGTTYDWRVRTNCSTSNSGFAVSQFTTTGACNQPTSLGSNSITSSSATVSWSAVSGSTSYAVDYKLNSASTWTNATSSTTSTSINLTGLSSGSLYDWRVRTNCSSTNSSYASDQFSTASAPTCPGSYDISTNGKFSGGATIPFNTEIYGLINPKADIDFYKFVINQAGTATITLTNLPADYNIKLYSSNGKTTLASSSQKGTTSETITRTYSTGTYYVSVFGNKGANNSSNCYTLKVATGTASGQETSINEPIVPVEKPAKIMLSIFPNPVAEILTVYIVGDNSVKNLTVIDQNGKVIYEQQTGEMFTYLDVSQLVVGNYIFIVSDVNGTMLTRQKFIKQ